MAQLDEWAKLEKDLVMKGVYTNILTADALTPLLQFKSFEGNSFVYNRESVNPTATSVATVGATFASTQPEYSKQTSALGLIYAQSDVHLYVKDTRGSVQDPEAVTISLLAKEVGRELARQVVVGDSAVVSTEFNGLDKICRTDTRMMAMDDGVVDGPGAAETELTLDRLDAMIDQVDDGRSKPDCLVMNTTMRRKLTALSRVSGSGVVMNEIDLYGHKVRTYDGVPIVISNHISDSEQYADSSTWTSSTATTIFAVKLGEENEGFTLIHNGSVLEPQHQRLAIPKNEHVEPHRLYIYVGSAMFSAKMVAALGGIDSAA